MSKKQVLYIALILFLGLLILPKNVDAQGKNEVLTCNYKYNDVELNYNVYTDGTIKLPFEDGVKYNEREWYHGYNFDSIFFASTKTSSEKLVCPTITIEESDSFYTVFNNPRAQEDCNGTCTNINADNNAVKKTIVLNTVAFYDETSYFIPYFRVLEDNSTEWTVDGENFYSTNESIKVKHNNKEINISLSNELVKNLFIENTKIYRCVSTSNEEYILTLNGNNCKTKEHSEKDGQVTNSSSYHGSLGKEGDRTTKDDLEDWSESEQNQNCGSGGILGDPNDENSVAWLLQQILNYIRVLGPMIVIVMSGIEFTKVIISSDDDGMAKAQKKLITRLILVAALFFVPTIVLALLDLFGMTNDPTCGLK